MKTKWNKKLYLLALPLFTLAGCKLTSASGTSTNPVVTSVDETQIVSVVDSGNNSDVTIASDTIETSFTLVDSNNTAITPNNGVYTITATGVYTAKGKLEGQILVNAPSLEVEIDLEGVSVSNPTVSPIFVQDAAETVIKVKKDTINYIYDNRTTDYSTNTDDTVGKSAIWCANGDLKINGQGTLVVKSVANSGIHGKDNVTVKNVTMLVKAVNNGIKGNDKVTIEENPTIGIVAGNNGIVTSNSDIGSKVQHGYIYITGGNITINSYGDGIDAAYAVEFNTSVDDNNVTYTPVVDIYTNIYSSYSLSEVTKDTTHAFTPKAKFAPGGRGGGPGGGFDGGGFGGGSAAEKSDSSAKGVKATETITINAGKIYTYTYDDGIHANNDALENGSTAKGNITVNGGSVTAKASDDAFHADGTLTVNGGEVNVPSSHEALEGNIIFVNGGAITVVGSDDGVNASSQINISGGRVDVSVSPNGDTDGIDSNGSITITGGVIISRGPNSEMAAPLDADGSMKATGGTLILIGYAPRTLSTSLTKTTSSSGLTTGTHTVTIGSTRIEYSNSSNYSGSTTVYASQTATVK